MLTCTAALPYGVVARSGSGSSGPRAYLPDELWTEAELSDPQHRQYTWPRDVERWVAVRIDLGDRRLATVHARKAFALDECCPSLSSDLEALVLEKDQALQDRLLGNGSAG